MNERIKELALKAGFKNYDGTSLYSPYIEGMELNDELQEFAELIVRECAEISITAEPYRSDDLILRHFGVIDDPTSLK
jgi:hypothetical protein